MTLADGRAVVLADGSVEQPRPERWAAAVGARAVTLEAADRGIALAVVAAPAFTASARADEPTAFPAQFVTARDGERAGPCILAGPSCDSADVLYEKRMIDLPLGLKSGDRVFIRSCGAYTSSYSSVGFNGFPPLEAIFLN